MYVVAVTLEINPERLDEFLPLMMTNAKTSVEHEPGCHQFDVAQAPDKPCQIFLYEAYDNAAAFQTHLTMPHFKSFDAAVADMLSEKTIKTYEIIST